jgi:putative heme-binding domain-containing protein
MIWVFLLWAQSAAQQQVQRGEALFREASHGCANCHALKGHGTAVGPDLSIIGRVSAQAIATAVRSSATQYVQTVKLKSGESFPGMPAGQDEKMLQFYDVSKMPPELHKIERAQLESATNQDQWKHPPSLTGYTSQQLADIIAYIRASVTGNTKTVSADEIE